MLGQASFFELHPAPGLFVPGPPLCVPGDFLGPSMRGFGGGAPTPVPGARGGRFGGGGFRGVAITSSSLSSPSSRPSSPSSSRRPCARDHRYGYQPPSSPPSPIPFVGGLLHGPLVFPRSRSSSPVSQSTSLAPARVSKFASKLPGIAGWREVGRPAPAWKRQYPQKQAPKRPPRAFSNPASPTHFCRCFLKCRHFV